MHNTGVQQRLSRWPAWISEGLPEFFAPTETGKRLHWKGPGKPNDMRMYELKRFLDAGDGHLVVAPGDTLTSTAPSAARVAKSAALLGARRDMINSEPWRCRGRLAYCGVSPGSSPYGSNFLLRTAATPRLPPVPRR